MKIGNVAVEYVSYPLDFLENFKLTFSGLK